MTEHEVLSLIDSKLRTGFEVERIILFGSRARGNARPDSDFDVLVIADSSTPFVRRQAEARQLLGHRKFPLDLLVYTPEEVRAAEAITGSAVYWALREGRVFRAAEA